MLGQIHETSGDCANTQGANGAARGEPACAVELAPIRPQDQPVLQEWLASEVSEESRYARFLGSVKELSAKQWQYLTEVDGHDHVAFVARRHGAVVGVGRWIRLPEQPDLAEVAFLVGDAHHHSGVGKALRAWLIDAARTRGVRRFRAHVLPHNRGIRGLLSGPELEVLRDTGRTLDVALRASGALAQVG